MRNHPSRIAFWIASRATGSGCVASSLATALGIETVENCDFRSTSRSVEARFEMGEGLLTASIVEILGQFVIRVVTRNRPLSKQLGELIAGNSS
jgi:hypothetical protein